MTLFAKATILGVCCLLFGALLVHAPEALLTAEGLQCEQRVDPLGVDRQQPSLSWEITSRDRHPQQTAYRVLVASTLEQLHQDQGDLWDTGKVEQSDASLKYQGAPLTSFEHCFWKVRLWNAQGEPGPWSQPGHWSVGPLQANDWQGEWIGYDGHQLLADKPAATPLHGSRWICCAEDAVGRVPETERVFRGLWSLPDSVVLPYRAKLYATADDSCLIAINGIPVAACSDHQLPIKAEVDIYVRPGINEVRAIVRNDSPGHMGLCLKLLLTDHQGDEYVLTTDERWFGLPCDQANWLNQPFDDAPPVKVIGPFGAWPWGQPSIGRDLALPPRYLRGGFAIDRPVRRATLYFSALGWADLYLNGHRIHNDYFAPGGPDDRKRAYYCAYDVTEQLRQGQNAWGAILADGWYADLGLGAKRNPRSKDPRLRAMLRVEFNDGTTQVVSTDRSWFVTRGPKRIADPLIGEEYDATREVPDWVRVGYYPEVVAAVDTGGKIPPILEWRSDSPVIEVAEVPAKSIAQPVPGLFIYDLGQSIVGVARLKVQGARGQRIQIRFSEALNDDGTLSMTNLRLAQSIDYYTCQGTGIEQWQPTQTFRRFRYVELTGIEHPPLEAITGIALDNNPPPSHPPSSTAANLHRLYQ